MQIKITIIKSEARRFSTTMRIVNQAEIELRAPQRMSITHIADFIAANTKFLAKSLTVKVQNKIPPTIATGADIYIFGEKFLVELQSAKRGKAIVDVPNKAIVLRTNGNSVSSRRFYELITPALEEYTVPRAKELAALMSETRCKKVRFKLVRSLWGSCTRTGNITFNKKLIHYPKHIIDYVIAHELAHLQEHNHSKAFWDRVKMYYPDVKQARTVLKSRLYS